MIKNVSKKVKIIGGLSALCLVLGVCFIVAFFGFHQGTYYEHSSMAEVEQLAKDKKNFVVYLARDDCPACQKTGKELKKHDKKLKENVYRVETRTEKDQEKLQAFLKQNHIKSVPSFIKINDQSSKKRVQFNYVLGVKEGK